MIKRINIVLLLILLFQWNAYAFKGYKITVKINNFKENTCYFGHYYGGQKLLIDTLKLNTKGEGVLKSLDETTGGMYFIGFPDGSLLNLLIPDLANSVFEVKIDYANLIAKSEILTNSAAQQYLNYEKRINAYSLAIQNYDKRIKLNTELQNKDSVEYLNNRKQWVIDEIEYYKKTILQSKTSNEFLIKLLKAESVNEFPNKDTKDPQLIKAKELYNKYKYFDKVDFSDTRLVNTEILNNKYIDYLQKYNYNNVDSINRSIDFILKKAKQNNEHYKQAVTCIGNICLTDTNILLEEGFVYLTERYILKPNVTWLTEIEKKKINEQSLLLKNLLIHSKPPALKLFNKDEKSISILEGTKKYTVLFFYSPDCDHCKEQIPFLKDWYVKNKEKDIEVIAISVWPDQDKFINFTQEQLPDFTNVYDPDNKSYMLYYYMITSTPQLYILDKDKKIILKKLKTQDLQRKWTDFLNRN